MSRNQANICSAGQAINNNNAQFLLQSDAVTPYYPVSPSSTGTPLAENCAIALGAPGNTVTATIPLLAGARIWFSVGTPLTFLLNPGPGLVEPSVTNPADPNINTSFSFAEFTFNSSELFANISYVDFVGVPIALTLTDTSGSTQHVSGMPANGLETVCNGLRAQTAKDGRRWNLLIVQANGQDLRALSPNNGIIMNPTWFETYWTDYVNQGEYACQARTQWGPPPCSCILTGLVYSQYTNEQLTIDTQATYGDVAGKVTSGSLNFGSGGTFPQPSARDIFSCSTGPFATGSNAETNVIIPRLAAAFNRSTLLLSTNQPDGVSASQYYTNATTNHYARIVHEANLDGLGYAFPYDDVTPDGGSPQEGAVMSGSPALLTVAVGGNNAYAG